MLPLKIYRDVQGVPSSGSQQVRPFPQYTQTVLLTTNTVEAVTVPTQAADRLAAFFSFTYGQDVFISPVASPALAYPTGTVTLSINELLTPGCGRMVTAGQGLQLLSPGTTVYVTISYYAIVQD